MNLFEKYEKNRSRFKPGTIWRDKGGRMVKELVIVSDNNPTTRPYHMITWYDSTNGDRVTFRIMRSRYRHVERLGEGSYASWDKKYMEDCYEPVLD